MSSRLPASHPDCRAVLIQIVALQTCEARDAWVSWVVATVENAIEAHRNLMREVLGAVIVDERERWHKKFDELERAFAIVRDESKIVSGLAALREEVEAARQRQPNYEHELASLRAELTGAQLIAANIRRRAAVIERRADNKEQPLRERRSVN